MVYKGLQGIHVQGFTGYTQGFTGYTRVYRVYKGVQYKGGQGHTGCTRVNSSCLLNEGYMYWSKHNMKEIEDITRRREDINFIFEW